MLFLFPSYKWGNGSFRSPITHPTSQLVSSKAAIGIKVLFSKSLLFTVHYLGNESTSEIYFVLVLPPSFPAQSCWEYASGSSVPSSTIFPKSNFAAWKAILQNEDIGPTKNVRTFFFFFLLQSKLALASILARGFCYRKKSLERILLSDPQKSWTRALKAGPAPAHAWWPWCSVGWTLLPSWLACASRGHWTSLFISTTRLESSFLSSLSLISLSLSLCFFFSSFLSLNRLCQLPPPFLRQPLILCHFDGALGPVLHCSSGLCLLPNSLLKTKNNRKSQKRKYLPVLKWLELMK